MERTPRSPGQEVAVDVTLFGAGISQFAQGSGMGATPSQNDGQYRVGYAKTTRTDADLYWYSSGTGDYIAGGDSGGPTYAWVLGGYALMGVHALTNVTCVPGQRCGPWNGPGMVPPGYNPWQFVAGTPDAADASIRAIWQRIEQTIGPPTTPADYQVPTPQGQAPFGGKRCASPRLGAIAAANEGATPPKDSPDGV